MFIILLILGAIFVLDVIAKAIPMFGGGAGDFEYYSCRILFGLFELPMPWGFYVTIDEASGGCWLIGYSIYRLLS